MCNTSSTNLVTQVNDTVNETNMTFLSKHTSTAKADAVTVQSMKIKGLKVKGCKFNATQNADIKSTAIQQLTEQNITDLKTELSTAVDAKSNVDASAETNFGSTGSAASYNKQDVVTMVKNVINKTVTVELVNEIIAQVNAKQKADFKDIEIDNCPLVSLYMGQNRDPPEYIAKTCMPPFPDCVFGQNLAVSVAAQQITNAITTAITNDSVLGSITVATESTASAKATGPLEGLGTLISAPIKAIGEIFGGGSLSGSIFSIICALIVLAAAYFYLTNRK